MKFDLRIWQDTYVQVRLDNYLNRKLSSRFTVALKALRAKRDGATNSKSAAPA